MHYFTEVDLKASFSWANKIDPLPKRERIFCWWETQVFGHVNSLKGLAADEGLVTGVKKTSSERCY